MVTLPLSRHAGARRCCLSLNGARMNADRCLQSGRTVPGAYTGATYAILPTTTTNATHWQLDVLCTGCSQWDGGSLNPNGVNSLAWAKNAGTVNSASSNISSFGIHDGRGVFSHDLSVAKIPQGIFDALAYGVNNPPSSSSSTTAVVPTAVTTLPAPVTTSASSAAASISTAKDTTPVLITSSRSAIPTRLTELPKPEPTTSSKTPSVAVTTRVTELPKPTTSLTRSLIIITTRVTGTLPTPILSPTRSTTSWIPDPPLSNPMTRPTTPGIVTTTVTARPPTTTQSGERPPWIGGPPWGKGKGKGGRWGRRGRIAAPPGE